MAGHIEDDIRRHQRLLKSKVAEDWSFGVNLAVYLTLLTFFKCSVCTQTKLMGSNEIMFHAGLLALHAHCAVDLKR